MGIVLRFSVGILSSGIRGAGVQCRHATTAVSATTVAAATTTTARTTAVRSRTAGTAAGRSVATATGITGILAATSAETTRR